MVCAVYPAPDTSAICMKELFALAATWDTAESPHGPRLSTRAADLSNARKRLLSHLRHSLFSQPKVNAPADKVYRNVYGRL